jgi:hypothetical protein
VTPPDSGARPAHLLRSVLLLLALALAARIAWPAADPASHLSWSNGVYTDPPTMVHAARNAVLFGEWIRDYNRDLWIYPLMNGLTWMAYGIGGVGRFPTLALSALLGVGTVGALAWGLRRTAGPRAALYGALLGTVNYWMTMYARIPLAENLVAMMLALACAAAAGRSPRAQLAAGALGVGATLFGKYHAVGFLPGLVLLPWLREGRFRATLPVLAGGTAAFLLWAAVILVPHGGDVVGHVERQSTGHGTLPFAASLQVGLSEFFNTLRRSWMFYRIPVCGALGGLFAIWTLGNGEARRRRVADGTAIYAFWMLGLWTYFSLLLYKAPRYYVLLGPPLVAGTAVLLAGLHGAKDWKLRPPRRWDEHVPLFVWLYAFCFGLIDSVKLWIKSFLEYLYVSPAKLTVGMATAAIEIVKRIDTFLANLVWAACLAIALYLFLLWNPEILGRIGKKAVSGARLARLGLAALFVAVGFGVFQYAWWAGHRSTFVEAAKASLPHLVGEDAVLLGPMAPLLTQDSGHRALPYFGPPNDPGLLERYGVTHVVLCGQGDADVLRARFPGLLEESSIVQIWPVNTLFASTLEIRRLPETWDGRTIHRYRESALEEASDLALQGDWKGVLERLDRYRAEGGPEIPELLSMESVCWFNLQDYDKAEERVRAAIAARPRDRLNWQNLGSLHLRRGERAEALEAFLQALRLNPRDEQLRKMILELAR